MITRLFLSCICYCGKSSSKFALKADLDKFVVRATHPSYCAIIPRDITPVLIDRTKDIINHECLSCKEHGKLFQDKPAEARKTVPIYPESGKEHWTEHRRGVRSIGVVEERRKKKRLGKNKIKEENRWQFFTSFLKRGLGTRGASLNRFFQRGRERPIFLPSSCAKRRKLYLPPAVSPPNTVVARRPSLDWNLKFRYLARRFLPLPSLFFSPIG